MLKKLAAFILTAALLSSLRACGERAGGNDPYGDLMEEIQSSGSPEQDVEGDKRTLTVFVQFGPEFEAHARAYMADRPDVEIKIEHVRDDTPVQDLPIAVQLMSGEGPDVAVYVPTWTFLHNGHFLDLYDRIEHDPGFHEEDYFMNVVSALETDGALYAMAYNFYFPALVAMRGDIDPDAAEQFQDAEQVTIADMISWQEDLGTASELDFYGSFFPLGIIDYYYSSIVDLESRSCDFKNQELVEMLARAKALPASDVVEYRSDGYALTSQGRSAYERFTDLVGATDHPYLFWNWAPLEDPQMLFPYEQQSFTRPRLVSDAAGNTLFDISTVMSITDSCKDPELAWDFIKFCIADKTGPYDWFSYNSESINLSSSVGYAPSVNRVTYAAQCELYTQYQYEFWEESEALQGVADPIGEKDQVIADTVDELLALPDQLGSATFPYAGIKEIIWPDLYLYLTDKQNIDVTLENIQSKVTLYLNE